MDYKNTPLSQLLRDREMFAIFDDEFQKATWLDVTALLSSDSTVMDLYADGTVPKEDVEAIDNLSDAATPYLVDLAQDKDERVSMAATAALSRRNAQRTNAFVADNLISGLSRQKLSAYEKKAAGTDRDIRTLSVILENDSDSSFREIGITFHSHKFRSDDEQRVISSGGQMNADGSLYRPGDRIDLREYIPEGHGISDFYIEIDAVTPSGDRMYLGIIHAEDIINGFNLYHIRGDEGNGFHLDP